MNILFKSVELCNFLSFGHAEVALSDRGYVLVKGVNNNASDNARSNGAGKTTIFNAICWALTGQTLYGMKSNIVNINADDGCYVKLEFVCDNAHYLLIRSKDHSEYKTDLKIYVDEKDVSGKGIRDSEKLLQQYLPDITPQLLGSVILLGQGLPQRFTNNTPSGRKEVLEKLSKSDFMIEDLKEKLSARKTRLSDDIRDVEDSLLQLTTQKGAKEGFVSSLQSQLKDKTSLEELKTTLSETLTHISDLEVEISTLASNKTSVSSKLDEIVVKSTAEKEKYQNELQSIQSKFDVQKSSLKDKIYPLDADINSKQRELSRLENIKDVCPTCGQHIPGAHKPDTTALRTEIESQTAQVSFLKSQLADLQAEETTQKSLLAQQFETVNTQIQLDMNTNRVELTNATNELNSKQREFEQLTSHRSSLEAQIVVFEQKQKELADNISKLTLEIEEINKKILYYNIKKEELVSRLSYVTKMLTIATRDFRGYLLSNIIEYIDACAKSYSKQIFDNDKILFTLSGNNLDISYDGKLYESLSTGEKQKIDIIIQLSLRDMLCRYMNFRCNILALDEVFDGLDSLGCEKVVTLINNITDISSIFIITHHTNDIELSYDYELTVVKNSSGISEII